MIFVFVRARHHVISLRHNRVGHYNLEERRHLPVVELRRSA